ncbi:unnamed protein product [Phytomonas sp. Hart1]|nr:unnamed protein product [Phytomonas sp. Hart1]|eukprot:CCW69953.1 unnamed protein product [Phytomonas sp. isolate Hart1]
MAVVLSKQCGNSYFLWEMLFPKSHNIFSMLSYRDSWRGFYKALPSDNLTSASMPSTDPQGPKTGRIFSFSSTKPASMVEHAIQQWRQQYLRLRARYGVELFLRYLPTTGETEAAGEGDCGSAIPPAHFESPAGGRFWWAILKSLWRRRPQDATPLYEIILANAVRVIGLHAGYAGLQLAGGETFWQADPPQGAAVSPYELNYGGAVGFAHFYLRELAKGRAEKETAGGGALAPWCCAADWAVSIQAFLAKVGVAEEAEALFARIYPCSVCDAAQAACLSWSFMFDSTHAAIPNAGEASSGASEAALEVHTTVFSPRTFSPLSFYSETSVLTKCFGCGFADFVVGPFCRICGGLLN